MKKIVVISDTHQKHDLLTIPEADILIHCGDFSNHGSEIDFHRFVNWFSNQTQCTNRIFCAGNHDIQIQKNQSLRNQVPNGIIYLQDNDVTIDGIKIYGTPWTPYFYDWAWNGLESKPGKGYDYHGGPGSYCTPDKDHPLLSEVYKNIPLDTNILVCHGPPVCGKVGKNLEGVECGSHELSNVLTGLKDLKFLFCGHIHEGRGIEDHFNGAKICNVSTLDRSYMKAREPMEFEI